MLLRPAATLICDKLVPLAREGLTRRGIESADADHYLEVIEARVGKLRTGSQWQVQSLGGMRAVAWTDVIQGTLLGIGCLAILYILVTSQGGLPAATALSTNTEERSASTSDRTTRAKTGLSRKPSTRITFSRD